MKLFNVLFLGFIMFISSCNNPVDENIKIGITDYTTGILTDLSSLDGCGWVIVLPDNLKLEPTNLNEFDIDLKEDYEIRFRYYKSINMGSVCMVGELIYITEIKNVNRKNCTDVVISAEEFENDKSDSFSINSAEINGNCLKVNFSASGCDGNTWKVKLIDSGAVNESKPEKRTLKFSIENKEMCEAYLTKNVFFNIEGLKVENSTDVLLNISGTDILYKF